MRITRATVKKLNKWAAEVSNGAVHIGFIGDLDRVLTYVDAHDAGNAYSGKTATPEAALYFGFAAHEYATRLGVTPPAWVDELLLHLLDVSPTDVTRAGDKGLDHVDTILPRRGHLTLVAAA